MNKTYRCKDIKTDIYEDHFLPTEKIFLMSTLPFPIIWFLFDYFLNEPRLWINAKMNIFVTLSGVLAFFLVRRFRKYYMIIWSAVFTLVNIYLMANTFYVQHKLGYALGLSCGFIFYSLVVVAELRYLLPSVLFMVIFPLFNFSENFQTDALNFYSFYFFIVSVSLFGMFGSYFKFQQVMKDKLNLSIIEKQKNDLEKSNETNRNLIRVLSHDIVNALHISMSSTNLTMRKMKLLNGEEKDLQFVHARLEQVLKSSKTVLHLVESVREWEKIRTGNSNVELKLVSIANALQDSIELVKDKLSQKNISIDKKIENELFIRVNEVVLINNIFQNILSNAIKFSPENSIIKIYTHTDDNHIKINIQDRGIGIPLTLIDKLFDPSKVTSRLGTNNEKGTGFGLSIVKEYMKHFDGDISVDSSVDEDDHGTTFCLMFPRH